MINIPTPYEIIHMTEKTTQNIQGTVLTIKDLIDVVRDNPHIFTAELEDELDDYAKENNVCPICGSELELKQIKEDRGEYQGFPCEETISLRYCPNHGCID